MLSLATDIPAPNQPSSPDDVRFCPVLTASDEKPPEIDATVAQSSTYNNPAPGHARTSPPHDPQTQQSEPSAPRQQFDVYRLTATQLRAIDLLVAGFPIVQVAETLHVSNRTVRRWKNAQPEFIAEYNRRILEHSSLTAGRLRQLADNAIAHVEGIFAGQDHRLKTMASLRILSCLISRHLTHHHGPTTAPEVLAEFVKQRLRAHNEDDKAPLEPYLAQNCLAELADFLETEQIKDEQEYHAQSAATTSA